MPLGLSARDRLLPIWEPLYSSKAASWVGMLLERVILGAVAAVGLTGRTEGGDGRGQEKRQGGQRSGPWGWGTRSERVEWGGAVQAQSRGWGWGFLLSVVKGGQHLLCPACPGAVALEGEAGGRALLPKPSHHSDVPTNTDFFAKNTGSREDGDSDRDSEPSNEKSQLEEGAQPGGQGPGGGA